MELPTDIYSVASVRRIDRAAIDVAGIGGYALMSRAGEAAYRLASERYPDAARWQVICGSGNNGGDGYVVARLAAEQGIAVSVVAMSPPDGLQGDAATAYADFAALGGAVTEFDGALDAEAGLLVDALLGSGLERPVEGRFADVVNAINEHAAPVLALDIPSGLHGDSGDILGTAVEADATVTFVGLKSGLFLNRGPVLRGELRFDGLGVPGECRSGETPVMRRIDPALVRRQLPRRAPDAHKGRFGHVLVVGGGPGMPGAAVLCATAALRAGAGLVSVAAHPSSAATVSAGRAELMCRGVESAADLGPLIERATVAAVGPGLGTGEWSSAMLEAMLDSGLPLVVDADALNLLATDGASRDDWILTPHPGEAARLLATTPAAVQADRRASLGRLQAQRGGVVVLKGSGSLVAAGQGAPWLCSAGNPGMASGGMGDALTGIIAGLLAQGLTAEMAAVCGVQVHAAAGDAAARGGERGLLAGDLIAEIRGQVNPG